MDASQPLETCGLCHRRLERAELLPAELVRPAIATLIRRADPAWPGTGFVCHDDLRRFRAT